MSRAVGLWVTAALALVVVLAVPQPTPTATGPPSTVPTAPTATFGDYGGNFTIGAPTTAIRTGEDVKIYANLTPSRLPYNDGSQFGDWGGVYIWFGDGAMAHSSLYGSWGSVDLHTHSYHGYRLAGTYQIAVQGVGIDGNTSIPRFQNVTVVGSDPAGGDLRVVLQDSALGILVVATGALAAIGVVQLLRRRLASVRDRVGGEDRP